LTLPFNCITSSGRRGTHKAPDREEGQGTAGGELHYNRSWEKELGGAETYCQRQEKTEGTRRQNMFLMDFIIIIIIVIVKSFKVSPSARCVSAANVICKEIDIFNKNKITLVDIDFTYSYTCYTLADFFVNCY
jgi:dolichyl-phosphate-mannose--protein O-mannosyl transferase